MKNILFFILFQYIGRVYSQELSFSFTPETLNPEIKVEKVEENVYVYTLNFSVDSLKESIEIKWESVSNNSYNYWASKNAGFVKPDWGSRLVTSYATSQAPVVSLYDNANQNLLTIAVSDALNTIQLSSGIIEETAMLLNKIKILPDAFLSKENYEISLRIDKRKIPYWQALEETSLWWASMKNFEPMNVPVEAKRPMYSTWYSFHQNLEVDKVLLNCKIAKSIGCDAVIVDDGWQTKDNNRGYAFTGDWKPERITQMKSFVDSIHALDMKIILWYSVPFVGEKSEVFKQFSEKFLSFNSWHGSGVLDPRYPEVRNYIINTYVKALNKWNIDGFKLDFVDSFKPTDIGFKDGMDYTNVNEASDRLLTDVKKALIAINPNVLIEFRQSYIGPLMRKYGNMFRAGDCPFSIHENRISTTNIRLLADKTATHSDMIMWHPNEKVEDAALQLLNVLFSVPQISVRLDEYPAQHVSMLKFWLNFWNKNSDLLLNSRFEAFYPNFNYPLLVAHNKDNYIAAVYQNTVIVEIDENIKEKSNLFIVNASEKSQIQVRSQNKIKGMLKIYDCTGNIVENKNMIIKGLVSIDVPKSGLIEFKIK